MVTNAKSSHWATGVSMRHCVVCKFKRCNLLRHSSSVHVHGRINKSDVVLTLNHDVCVVYMFALFVTPCLVSACCLTGDVIHRVERLAHTHTQLISWVCKEAVWLSCAVILISAAQSLSSLHVSLHEPSCTCRCLRLHLHVLPLHSLPLWIDSACTDM